MLCEEEKLDPRVRRTRRDLAASMCSLLREKSFNQIKVQEITERAIINRATFYAHFEDKYRLLEYMVRGSFQEALANNIDDCDGYTASNLRKLMLATCQFLEEFDDKYAPPSSGDGHAPITQQVQPMVYEVLLSWATRSGLPSAENIAITTSWAIFGTVLQWSRGQRDLSAETLTESTITLLTQGLNPILETQPSS